MTSEVAGKKARALIKAQGLPAGNSHAKCLLPFGYLGSRFGRKARPGGFRMAGAYSGKCLSYLFPRGCNSREAGNGSQASKGAGWMPWLREAMKDVVSCDKLRVGASGL